MGMSTPCYDAGRAAEAVGLDFRRMGAPVVAKASSALDKWLILQALNPFDARGEPRPPGTAPGAAAQARAIDTRGTAAHPDLPSDWLFSIAAEPMMIVDAPSGRIMQANPAAAHLLRNAHAELLDRSLPGMFHASGEADLARGVQAARAGGNVADVTLRPACGGSPLRAKLSLFRADSHEYLLVHLAPIEIDGPGDDALLAARQCSESPVFDAIDSAAVGFVLTDSGLRIEYANKAFGEMIEIDTAEHTIGRSLVRWLELSEGDLTQLRDQMLQRQATSLIAGSLRTESSSTRDVEICAVAVPDDPHTCWGFTIRELPRLN
jgi:PAS domain-containing protein